MVTSDWRTQRAALEAALEVAPEAGDALLRRFAGVDTPLAQELLGLAARARSLDPGVLAGPLVPEAFAAAPLAETVVLPTTGTRVGPFRIVSELGRGGMAVVFRAQRDDGEFAQTVALKWIGATEHGALARELLRRERQALAALEHPNIARLVDGGHTADGQPWFAMEFVDGMRLDLWCEARAAPRTTRLGLFLDVCGAVAHAHARGVLHRDLKPSNVLVDDSGRVKLLDFGIAELLEGNERLAQRAYTPGVASPEHVRGERLTVAADVYQLGRLLDRLLADDLDFELRALIARATRASAEARYPTVEALAADVRRHAAHRPIDALPHHLGYLAQKFLQRHVLSVSASAMAATLVLSLGVHAAKRIRDERDAAEHRARVADATLTVLREDFLAAASPGANLGREITVREALDIAAASLGARFQGAPHEEALVRLTLADLYLGLGRLSEAEREARQAANLAQADGRMERHVSLEAGYLLAQSLLRSDELDEAEETIRPLLDEARGIDPDGPWVRERTRCLQLEADLAFRRGDYAVAERVSASILAEVSGRLGTAEPSVRSSTNLWTDALRMLGRHLEAIDALDEALAARRAKFGPRHPVTLDAQHRLAVVMRHAAQAEQALPLLSETLVLRREVLGPEHPETLVTANELASCHQDLRQYAEAEVLFVETLATRERVLGEEHIYTRNSMSNLGLLYTSSGRLDEAEALYRRALALDERLSGGDHPDVLTAMHNLAGLLRRRAAYDDALELHEQVIERAGARLGPDAWQVGLYRFGLARTLCEAGRRDAAQAALELAIEGLDRSLGADHARTRRAREMGAELGL